MPGGVLKYKDGASYVPLYGGAEEVTISASQPPIPTDLWLDTDDDTAYPDNILSGFRNVIRNGDMSVAQRGDGPFTATGYCLDGWTQTVNGGSASTTRAVAMTLGTPASHRFRTVISGQAAAGDRYVATQHMEGVHTFSGKTATISFSAYATTAPAKIGLELQQSFGSGGSSSVNTSLGAIDLTTTLTRYSMTVQIPSVAGMTLGSDGLDKLSLSLWFSAGSTYAARASNIGIQNNTFSVTDVQMEEGPIATPFERLPRQQQLAWCQRYFQRLGNGTSWLNFGLGLAAGNTTNFALQIKIPAMRASPAVTYPTAANTFVAHNGSAGAVISAFGAPGSSPETLDLAFTTSGLVAYQPLRLLANGAAVAYIDASAEL